MLLSDRKIPNWLHLRNELKPKIKNTKSEGANIFSYATHAVLTEPS